MTPFWVAVLGAVVGGGGVTIVARLALTESLRKVFADKEDVVTPMTMHEKIGETAKGIDQKMNEFAEKLRRELQSPFIETAARIEREHNALRTDLDRAIGALDQASRSLREEGRNSAEAVKQASLAQKEVEGLTKLYEALSIRLGHVERACEGIQHIATAVDNLKAQLEDVLNYQIAEERRRTGGKP